MNWFENTDAWCCCIIFLISFNSFEIKSFIRRLCFTALYIFFYFQDESFGLEEALNSAFINIRDGLNKRESSPSREQTSRKPDAGTQSNRPTRSASQSPALKHRDLCPRRAFPIIISTADVANDQDTSEVVKCHIGVCDSFQLLKSYLLTWLLLYLIWLHCKS